MRLTAFVSFVVFSIALCPPTLAQTQPAAVPHVIRYSGSLKHVDGSVRSGTVGVTFSIYADQSSTAPLWTEVQNVIVDDTGHYTVLLGAARSEGLPDGLFATNEARWLAIRVENEQEQPRVILAAVPYALKAADAETLGGKPLSAFVLNDATSSGAPGGTGSGGVGSSSEAAGSGSTKLHPLSINTSTSGGTQNQVAKWTDAGGTILGNSILTDTGSAVGVNNTTPTTAFDVSGTIRAVLSPAAPFGTYLMPTGGAANSFRFGFGNNLYFDGTNWRTKGDGANNAGSGVLTDIGTGALSIFTLPSTGATDQVYSDSSFNGFEKMRISQTGNVGINNTSPSTTLDVGGTIRAVLGAGAPFGTYLMPTGGAANSFRFGFGNNLYFDGTNWRTKGDGAHNAGSGIITDIASGALSIFTLPSTGATDQVISNSSFNSFEKVRITSDGKMGIGTTTPAQALDVTGSINASGNIAANGTISGSNLSATGTVTLTGTPTGNGVSNGALYLNPASASAVQTLFGVAVGGVQKLLVDATGNLSAAGVLSGTSLALPSTTNSSAGVITFGGMPFLHNYGSNNTFLGTNSGNTTMTGTGNTAVGANALQASTTGGWNVAVGTAALANNTIGTNNSAVGEEAGAAITNGSANSVLGYRALYANSSGARNVAVGFQAMYSGPSFSSVAIGSDALHWGNGMETVAIGDGAMEFGSLGSNNVAIGFRTLRSGSQDNNTALGTYALGSVSVGYGNTALGYNALSLSPGNNNIAVGSNAGSNIINGNNNIYVGNPGANGPGESGVIRIGTAGTQNSAFLSGIRGVNTANNDAVAVLIDSAGQLGTVSSSREVKQDIADMGAASDRVMKLRPVTFRYKQPYGDGSKPIQYGLIAEEVAETFPELAAYGASGKVETVKYHLIPVLLLNEVQRQQKEIGELRTEVEKLRAERQANDELRREMEELRGMVMQSAQK